MVAHSLVVALLAAVPTGSPEPAEASQSTTIEADAAERTPHQLRDAVHRAMRRQATAKGAEQEAAVRELAAVHQALLASTGLSQSEQRQLRAMVRNRLARTSAALERQLAKAAKPSRPPGDRSPQRVALSEDSSGDRAILAQFPGNPAGQPANAAGQPGNPGQRFGPGAQVVGAAQNWNAMTTRNAEQLIELIQNTIAPASWDVNGGFGSIMYFAPSQVLVIRQSGGIHDQVGQAIQGLRRN